MSLVLGLGEEVEAADQVLELISLSVDSLEEGRVQVVLVVKLGDLGLLVELDSQVGVPVVASQLCEEVVGSLATLGLRVLLTLGQSEWESEQLLLVRWVQAQLLNGCLVLGKTLLSLLLDLLVGAETWGVEGADLVDDLLEGVRIAFDSTQLSRVAERDVFQTVDLAELPEDWVRVFTLALHAENLGQVRLLGDTLDQVVQQLRLRQRVLVVHGQEVEESVLLRVLCGVLKEAEAADDIVLALVGLSRDALAAMSGLLEETHRQLHAAEVGKTENATNHGVAHPCLAKHCVGSLHLTLNRHPSPGCEGTASESPHLLNLLDAHDLVDLLGILVVVAVRSLNSADCALTSTIGRV